MCCGHVHIFSPKTIEPPYADTSARRHLSIIGQQQHDDEEILGNALSNGITIYLINM
jgi:hypothetical protein